MTLQNEVQPTGENGIENLGWRLEHSYAELPDTLSKRVDPAPVRAPKLVIANQSLAGELGLDFSQLTPEEMATLFSGQTLPSQARPIAQAYAGHQFGGFTMLGDGRAILIGEQRTPTGQLLDIQFKGSGETPFSRRGDGLAALGPMLREYIISEAMHGLGIPTTRSLAVVATGDIVYRETPLAGAILTRIASSHIRVGTFQYLAALKDTPALQSLAEYAIRRHYPDLTDSQAPYLDLLNRVIEKQAQLIAQWQLVGFVHGVMNTDNVTICGETIDYGPCAFMDVYHPETVFSSIDHGGRYAYQNQPPIGQWNLARFAETLIPLLDSDTDKAIEIATDALSAYPQKFEDAWLSGMLSKLGINPTISTPGTDSDRELVESLLTWMQDKEADFTNTFDDLTMDQLDAELYQNQGFKSWHSNWESRLKKEGQSLAAARERMIARNPAFIARNHRVEEALAAASNENDLSPLNSLLALLQNPFQRRSDFAVYRNPAPADQCYRTFCGT
ncbi:MAG: protein adenylyltransferase SelO [Aureliella sp.]